MKKFLLSMVALLGMGLAASAVEVSLPADGKKWNDYTWTKNGNDYKGVVENYSLTLAKGESTNDLVSPDQYSIRIYAGANLTVTAPSGVTFNKVTVTINATGNKATSAAAEGWTVSEFTDGVFTMTSATAKSSVTFDGNGKQLRVASLVIEASGEGGEPVNPDPDPDPDPQPTGKKYEMVNALTTGSYVFVVNEDGTYKLGTPAAATVNYGRISLVAATVENNTVNTDAANAFTITVNGDKATIQDANGRYYGMDDSHFTSFQFYTEHNEGCDYTFAFEGNNVKFTNALNTNCIIAQSKGTQGTWYANVAPAKEPTEFNLPMLFKEGKSDGIADITVDENAPVEYFNLQGVRVANPENGLYIRRQGNKATKVLVK